MENLNVEELLEQAYTKYFNSAIKITQNYWQKNYLSFIINYVKCFTYTVLFKWVCWCFKAGSIPAYTLARIGNKKIITKKKGVIENGKKTNDNT